MTMIQTMAAAVPQTATGPRGLARPADPVGGADGPVGESSGGGTSGRRFEHALADADADAEPDKDAESEKEFGGDKDQGRAELHVLAFAAPEQTPATGDGGEIGRLLPQASSAAVGPLRVVDVDPAVPRAARDAQNLLQPNVPDRRGTVADATTSASALAAGVTASGSAARTGVASELDVAASVVATTGVATALHTGETNTAARGGAPTATLPATPDANAETVPNAAVLDPGADEAEPVPVRAAGATPAVAIAIDAAPVAQVSEPVAAPGAASGTTASPASGATASTASASTASSVPTSAPLPLDGEDPHLGLAATVRSLVEGGRSVARIDVTPADLGPLSIEIDRGPDRLAISVQAAHPAARELIDALLPRLRESLTADGFGEVRASVGDDVRQDARQEARQHAARDDGSRDPGRAPGRSDEGEPAHGNARERLSDQAASAATDRRAGDGDVGGAPDARLREFELDVAGADGARSLIDRWA